MRRIIVFRAGQTLGTQMGLADTLDLVHMTLAEQGVLDREPCVEADTDGDWIVYL